MNFSVRCTLACGVHVALGAPLAMRSRSAHAHDPAQALRVEIERDERPDRRQRPWSPPSSPIRSPHLRSPARPRRSRRPKAREQHSSRTIWRPAYDASVWMRARSPVKTRCCDSVGAVGPRQGDVHGADRLRRRFRRSGPATPVSESARSAPETRRAPLRHGARDLRAHRAVPADDLLVDARGCVDLALLA